MIAHYGSLATEISTWTFLLAGATVATISTVIGVVTGVRVILFQRRALKTVGWVLELEGGGSLTSESYDITIQYVGPDGMWRSFVEKQYWRWREPRSQVPVRIDPRPPFKARLHKTAADIAFQSGIFLVVGLIFFILIPKSPLGF